MKTHSHPFWLFLSSSLMRTVLAGLLFVGMMIWTSWVLFASVWKEAEIAAEKSGKTNDEPVSWIKETDVADGPAYQGPWRMNDSEFHFVDDPSVDIDEEGAAALVWTNQTGKNIFFQFHHKDGAVHPEEPANISASPDIFSWLPRVVISPVNRDHIFVLWQEIIFSGGSHGGEILFARSTDRGQSFSEPINLSNTQAGAGKGRLTTIRWDNGSLDLAAGENGTIYAAWTEYEGALRISHSIDNGVSFSEPVTVTGDQNAPARGPSLAVDPDGIIHLVWTVGEDRTGDIHYTRSSRSGEDAEELRFQTPQVVAETDGHSEAPKIVVDSQGTLHLVNAESPGGLFQHYHIYYSQLKTNQHQNKNTGQHRFSEPVRVSEPHPGRFESANYPGLGLDKHDNPYIIWELFPDRQNYPQGLGFSASFDNGQTFSHPSQIPGTGDPEEGFNGSRQGLLMNKLAVSPAGDILVVNSTFLEGEASNIRLIRGKAELN